MIGDIIMSRYFELLCLCLILAVAGCGGNDQTMSGLDAVGEEKTIAADTDTTSLPRALLIGDSISKGYIPYVKKILQGKVQVMSPSVNCQSTIEGLRELDNWLGNERWDVIHFNWGLHDVKYIDSRGKKVEVSAGTQKVSIEQYEKNLEELVIRLKKTGAKLIFATTTPVPDGAGGRIKGDAARYNIVAVKIMNKHGITVDDLYSRAMQKLDEIQKPRDVHFINPQGDEFLAGQVAEYILQAL